MGERWTLVVALIACIAGCNDPRRGEAGESCTRRDDCVTGLLCVAQVCVAEGDGGAPSSGTVGGAVGDSCEARRDCAEGLACMAGRCQPAMVGTTGDVRYSGTGESCRAQNDCAPELSCVGAVCRALTLELPPLSGTCARVECADDDDCCADFVPNANCAIYQENCAMDPIFCNTFRTLCECNRTCHDELCVAGRPGCSADEECASAQTPFCVESECRQCAADSNCPGEGALCVDGVCLSPCVRDENCPLLHACEEGECVEVGCRSDRECAFAGHGAQAACVDGECTVPCESDADCGEDALSFEICRDGACVFVGCDSDAECRALLGVQNTPAGDPTHAVCR